MVQEKNTNIVMVKMKNNRLAILAFCIMGFVMLPPSAKAHERVQFCPEILDKAGSLWIESHVKVDSIIAARRENNERHPGIDGYRIQLSFAYQRRDIQEIEAEFLKKYPDVPTYLIYEQPYFKLRVGNYRSLIEVQYFYYELLEKFGNVFIVPTRIELPELKATSR